jgi:hypothetical protein
MGDDGPTPATLRRVTLAVVLPAAICVGIGAAWWAYQSSLPRNTATPEDAARAWATKLKLPYRGAACTMFDSDDDGYVSCVVALDGPDRVYFQGLQCGELNSRRGGGCKPDAKNPEVHLVLELSSKPTESPREGR